MECINCGVESRGIIKTGLCRKCLVEKRSKEAYRCIDCNKRIGQNKSHKCRECLKIGPKFCTKCNIKISNDNKSGVCIRCQDEERKKNIRYCKKCKINKLKNNNKSGFCFKCHMKNRSKDNKIVKSCVVCGKFVNKNSKSKRCVTCIDNNLFRKKRPSRKPVFCKDCQKQISHHNKKGLCITCSKIRTKIRNEESQIFCKLCNAPISKGAKTGHCKNCYSIGRVKKEKENNNPICKNAGCTNKISSKNNKFCSPACMYEGRKYEKIEQLKKEGKYEEYLESLKPKFKRVKRCKIHNIEISSDSVCIKCNIEKLEKNKVNMIKNGWKVCGSCSSWIRKGRTRCRSCIEKDFIKRKELNLFR